MLMRRVAAELMPPWLEPLLTTRFFSTCSLHAEASRSECNMFCLDCAAAGLDASFCFYCRFDRHPGHSIIQIRRSSYHDVVRVTEVQKTLDITGVQTYVINSARVLFLNERPQPRGGKGSSSHACEICARALQDSFRFCSLGCKLAGIKKNGDACFLLDPAAPTAADAVEKSKDKVGVSERGVRRDHEDRDGSRESVAGGLNIHLPAVPSRSKRRKGIPHRSPFTS